MSNKTPKTPTEEEESWCSENSNNNSGNINFDPSTKCNIKMENSPPNTHTNTNTNTTENNTQTTPTTVETTEKEEEEEQQQQPTAAATTSPSKEENKTENKENSSSSSSTTNNLTTNAISESNNTPQNLSLKTLSGNQVKSIIINTLPTQRISIKSGTKSRLNQMTESQVINIIKQYSYLSYNYLYRFGNPYSYKVYINHMTNSIESVDVTFPTTSISELVFNGLDDKGFAVKYVNEENSPVDSS